MSQLFINSYEEGRSGVVVPSSTSRVTDAVVAHPVDEVELASEVLVAYVAWQLPVTDESAVIEAEHVVYAEVVLGTVSTPLTGLHGATWQAVWFLCGCQRGCCSGWFLCWLLGRLLGGLLSGGFLSRFLCRWCVRWFIGGCQGRFFCRRASGCTRWFRCRGRVCRFVGGCYGRFLCR